MSSSALFHSASQWIPGGVNSPARDLRRIESNPLFIREGKGDTLWDEDGIAYIDYCAGFGALILGHAPAPVVQVVCRRAARGSLFGLCTIEEQQLAQKVVSHVPSVKKVRFVNSGTEAVMAALRLARAYTSRSLIIKFDGHYHGHLDQMLETAGSSALSFSNAAKQQPKTLVLSLPFNDIDVAYRAIREHAHDLAGVILEPIAGNMGVIPADSSFLHMLQEETQQSSSLLIVDEVITGFRLGLGGAQQLYGLTPDLTCFGKILGGGYPAAAVGGKEEIMDLFAPQGDVFLAGTFSGNPVSMAAGLATLSALEMPGLYTQLAENTKKLLDPVQKEIQRRQLPIWIAQIGSMFSFFLGCIEAPKGLRDLPEKAQLQKLFHPFFNTLKKEGILLSPSPYETHFLSAAHTEKSIAKTAAALLIALDSIK